MSNLLIDSVKAKYGAVAQSSLSNDHLLAQAAVWTYSRRDMSDLVIHIEYELADGGGIAYVSRFPAIH